jgi:hypothetical protein
MYELVPPSSKVIEYKSVYMPDKKDSTFGLKIFNYDEDEQYTQIYLSSLKTKDGEIVKDDSGTNIIDVEYFYIEILKLGLDNIDGKKDKKFSPSWKLTKELVNKIIDINSVANVGKA